MIFRHYVPAAPLSHFIDLMWFGADYIVPHTLERVLPTGDMSLIINLHEDRTRIYDADDPRKYKTLNGAIVVGAYFQLQCDRHGGAALHDWRRLQTRRCISLFQSSRRRAGR